MSTNTYIKDITTSAPLATDKIPISRSGGTVPAAITPSGIKDFVGTGGASFGTTPNLGIFEIDGTLRFEGTATVWDDINISLIPGVGLGGSAPSKIAIAGDSRLDCYAFSGINSTPDEYHGSLEILHDYKEGSDIYAHIHWAATTNTVANVKWQLRYMWVEKGGIFGGGQTISITTPTLGVAWQEQRSVFPAISGVGHAIGGRFVFCLFRDAIDAQDTYAADAAVFDFGIHTERDTLGSRLATAK